jgi:hypothetical protein
MQISSLSRCTPWKGEFIQISKTMWGKFKMDLSWSDWVTDKQADNRWSVKQYKKGVDVDLIK